MRDYNIEMQLHVQIYRLTRRFAENKSQQYFLLLRIHMKIEEGIND